MQQATHRRLCARVAVSEASLLTSSITAEAKCLRNQFFLCKPLRYKWQCLVRSASECHGSTASAIRPINALLKGTSDLLTCSRFMVLLNHRPNFLLPKLIAVHVFSHIVFSACKRRSGHVAHGQTDEPTGRRGTEGGEKCEERGKGGGVVKPPWNQRRLGPRGASPSGAR